MQYALFYIDFFVNNTQKNHHLTALNGNFIIVCVTFLIIPFNRLSPFLLNHSLDKDLEFGGVNALYRAFSISTLPIFVKDEDPDVCQCPLSGFLHFYILMPHFRISTLTCVNALYRAFSISTLPSGNALKWSICRLDFAGNCLTTSKSAYFLLFLCLFTLCSYFVTVQHKKIIDNTMSLFIVLLILFLW